MSVEIAVTDYCVAFETWARVARQPEEQALVEAGTAHLRARFDGYVLPGALCRALAEWAEQRPENLFRLQLAVEKSCLLARMLYAREPLRTEPCPIHRGRWSGCQPEACPAGCNFGWDLTGWLPQSAAAAPTVDRSLTSEELH